MKFHHFVLYLHVSLALGLVAGHTKVVVVMGGRVGCEHISLAHGLVEGHTKVVVLMGEGLVVKCYTVLYRHVVLIKCGPRPLFQIPTRGLVTLGMFVGHTGCCCTAISECLLVDYVQLQSVKMCEDVPIYVHMWVCTIRVGVFPSVKQWNSVKLYKTSSCGVLVELGI